MNIKGKTIKDISIITTELAGDSCMLVFDDNTTLRIDPLEGRRLFFWPNAEVRGGGTLSSVPIGSRLGDTLMMRSGDSYYPIKIAHLCSGAVNDYEGEAQSTKFEKR